VVFGDRVVELGDQFLHQGHFLFGNSEPALRLAQRLLLFGV
jgi:hypothetical protein